MSLYNKIFEDKGKLSQEDVEKYTSGNATDKERHNIEAKSLQNKLYSDALDGFSKHKTANINTLKTKTLDKLFKNNTLSYLIVVAAMLAFVTIIFFIPFKEPNKQIVENVFVKNIDEIEQIINAPKSEEIATVKEKVVLVSESNIINNERVVKEIEYSKGNKTQTKHKVKTRAKKLNNGVENNNLEIEKSYAGEGVAIIANEESQPKVSSAITKEIVVDDIDKTVESKKIIKKEVFSDNFPHMFLAELKIANYRGKRAESQDFNSKFETESMSAKYSNNRAKQEQTTDETVSKVEYYYNDYLEKALFKLKKQKHTEAIIMLDDILKKYPEDINSKFYKGIAYYQLEKYSKAINNFNLVLNDTINIFNPEAKWKKTLCLLHTNKKEGIIMLKEIVDEAGFYSQKAIIKLEEEGR